VSFIVLCNPLKSIDLLDIPVSQISILQQVETECLCKVENDRTIGKLSCAESILMTTLQNLNLQVYFVVKSKTSWELVAGWLAVI